MTAGWELYDYCDAQGVNALKKWSVTLDSKELSKLNAKLDLLSKNALLPPNLLVGPLRRFPHLYVLKVRGDVQIRVFLCKGPVDKNKEFTLLTTAIEKDRKYKPSNAWEIAEQLRITVEANPKGRRRLHERVGKAAKTRIC